MSESAKKELERYKSKYIGLYYISLRSGIEHAEFGTLLDFNDDFIIIQGVSRAYINVRAIEILKIVTDKEES